MGEMIELIEVETVMEAIAALVPLGGGQFWSGSFAPQWPRDYTSHEVVVRRAIATAAILAIRATPNGTVKGREGET